MPRLRRRPKARRRMPEGAVLQLRTGYDYLGNGFGEDASDETLRFAWKILQKQVMEAERRHRGGSWPGRPWAWWRFEYEGPPIPPHTMDHWAEASILLDAGALTPEEMARMPELVASEVKTRTERASMVGGEELLESILDLQRRVAAAVATEGTP